VIDNLETSATLDTRNRPKTKKLVPNLETYRYVTLDTRHRPKTKKTGSQSRDICNSGHKKQTEDKKKMVPNLETYVTLDTRHRPKTKKLVPNIETYVTLDTRHRPKTKSGSPRSIS
jgi:t-SNARE complex subunit (syntaxin)